MIVHYLQHGRALVDREVLAAETGLSMVTIRLRLRGRHIEPEYDRATRRALYDHDTARAALADVVPWPAMQKPRRKRWTEKARSA